MHLIYSELLCCKFCKIVISDSILIQESDKFCGHVVYYEGYALDWFSRILALSECMAFKFV